MNAEIQIFKGHNGTVELSDTTLTIKRKGALAFITQGLKGDKEIPVTQLTALQFKKAGMLTNGYIQFSILGGQEGKGGVFQATTDENTVMFTNSQQSSFDKLKAELSARMNAKQAATPVANSLIDDLERLASLRDRGVLTEDEFQAKKKQILGL